MHTLWPSPWKQSLWQNTDQSQGKNQSQRLDLLQSYLARKQVDSQNDIAEAMILTIWIDNKCYDNLE